MASFFITGASRGFGLALTKELLSLPASKVSKVIASSRSDSPALNEIVKGSSGRADWVKLDVTDQESIKKAAVETEAKLGGKGLDVLINNAGICEYAFQGTKSMENLSSSFLVNVQGVHWVTQAFFPLLEKGQLKKVANISTTLGSIALAGYMVAFPAPAYKITKAALNALTVQWALDHEKDGFTFIALCPGWLKTELGGGDMADLTPEQGAKASLDIIFNKSQKEVNGQLPKVFVEGWDKPAEGRANVYDGTNAPW
ncbi:hypothetical protein B0T21DRAFT_385572 [Apiosordaria backusii]|uniref:Uncharacterized protein n=1 Tax=Apiosordaria backusii TaxID=314023 RepID=A0AA40B258_9PEZI|nr:hypothetical protein B0T21DRAFT_385572 [Apiosordaria backusii]